MSSTNKSRAGIPAAFADVNAQSSSGASVAGTGTSTGLPAAFANPDDFSPAQSQDAFIRDFNSKIVAASEPGNLAAVSELHSRDKSERLRLHRAAQSDTPVAASPTPDFNPQDVPQPHMEHPALPTPHTVPFDAKR